jgi:putative beta-lysine N-acetyltransferase
MTIRASRLFDAAFGATEAEDATRSLELATSAGRCEAVLDPPNQRVKLLGLRIQDLDEPEIAGLIAGLSDPALPYTKLTVYALPGDEMAWITRGFLKEGVILGFFADGINAHVWARFADDGRDLAPRDAEHDRILIAAAAKTPRLPQPQQDLTLRTADEDDAAAVSQLLQDTFSEYPTSLDADVIRNDMLEGARRFALFLDDDHTPVGVASAEIDHRRRSAEMTDCAVRPELRGRGLVSSLLWRLELDLQRLHGIRDLYTLARADEPGMNCAFARLGYLFTGRLINNCRMPNGWESMNIWCRRSEPVSGLDPDQLL